MIRYLAAMTALLLVALPSSASALVIQLQRQSFGTVSGLVFGNSGNDGRALIGGGTLDAIMAEAAARWERELLDDRTVQIRYGWATNLQPTVFGATARGNQIAIGINHRDVHYMDAAPETDDEFDGPVEIGRIDLGGGELTYGHVLTGLAIGGNRLDLLATATHEIGHAIMLATFGLDPDPDGNGFLSVDDPLPFAGSELPLRAFDEFHLRRPDGYTGPAALMDGSLAELRTRTRELISDADVLYVAQASGYTQLGRFDVPEPASMGLLGGGVLLLGLRRRRSKVS